MSERDDSLYEAKKSTIADLLKLGLSATAPDEPADLMQPGMRVDRYQLVKRIGRGGMGEVWLSVDTTTGTRVAVKWMHASLSHDEASRHRFLTESKHMSGLSHPHIVTILNSGDEEDRPYYVTPLYKENLAGYIARNGPLEEGDALRIAASLADALAYAHSRGITHRDLKPANILLDENANAYVCDFGLVRTVFNDSIVNVQKKTLEGTAAYMSPAAACGDVEDTRCDIYGWGAILYEMLTGKPPYEGPTVDAVLEAVKTRAPRPVLELNKRASKPLSRVAAWAMARELRDRYAEMNDVNRDLLRLSRGKSPLGPGRNNASHTLPYKGIIALSTIVFLLAAGVMWKKSSEELQDMPIEGVGTSETIQKEKEDMNALAKLAAIALTTQVINTQAIAEVSEAETHSASAIILTAPYPESYPGAETDKLSLQYAVAAVASQANLAYDMEQGRKGLGAIARRWVTPDIKQLPFPEAMDQLLMPLGVLYEVRDGAVVLRPRLVTLTSPYQEPDGSGNSEKISLQYAVMEIAKQAGLGYDFAESQKNLGETARRWVTPDIQQIPFLDAMDALLNPLGVTFKVKNDDIILMKRSTR